MSDIKTLILKQYTGSFIDSVTGENQTFKELLTKSIRVAQHFQTKGYNTDDVVALCLPNTLDSCLPFLASVYLRIKVASLDPTLPQKDCGYLLNIIKPKVIFCIDTSVDTIESALVNKGLKCEIVVLGNTGKYDQHTPFSEFLVSTGMEDNFEVTPVKDLFETAVIFFSSGTTGLPKGICCTHYGLLLVEFWMKKSAVTNISLYFTSLYWISSVAIFFTTALRGHCRIVVPKFEAETVLKLIEKYKVTFTFCSPFLAQKIIQSGAAKRYDTTSMRSIIIGGSSITEYYLKTLRKLFPNSIIYFCYGMTENAGYVVNFDVKNDRELMDSKIMALGKPLPDYVYKVVDVDTQEALGPNKLGEVCLKGKGLMCGYYNNKEEFTKVWDAEGFFHTGDIGYYDEDLCFFLIDRLKEVIKFQSWHVSPSELESLLLTHPAVLEAGVFGKPHHDDGEHPMAAVVLKPGILTTTDEILDFVNDQVSDRKKLRGGVVFVKHLPHTSTGKLLRRQLRDTLITK